MPRQVGHAPGQEPASGMTGQGLTWAPRTSGFGAGPVSREPNSGQGPAPKPNALVPMRLLFQGLRSSFLPLGII